MPDPLLTDIETARLRAAALTYPEVGATSGPLPAGYHHLTRTAEVGHGRERFDAAARTVLTWEMHRRAGVAVRPSEAGVTEGGVAVLRLGIGPLAVEAPVRVVALVEEERRRGFVYGTLPGHPETGEESFVVRLHDDDRVTFTVTAFSRPATLLARLGGPVGRAVQALVTERYVRAVRG